MRGMLHGERPTASGPRYAAKVGPQRPAADPGAPAAPHRRRRRAGHAQARRPLRRRQQRRRRVRRMSGARRRSSSSTARRSGATRPRSSGRAASARSSSATRAAEAERVQREMFGRQRQRRRSGRTSRSARPRTSPRSSPRTSDIGYRHLIAGLPGPVRRGVDDTLRDRGPRPPRARLSRLDAAGDVPRPEGLSAGQIGRAIVPPSIGSMTGRPASSAACLAGPGGEPPWPGCHRSPCRTSVGAASARRRRRTRSTSRRRTGGCAPAVPRSARPRRDR